MLVCVLAVVRGPVESELGVPRSAFAVRKPNAPLDGFRHSSVVLVANKVSIDVLLAAVRALPRAPTQYLFMCKRELSMLPYLTSKENQIMDVTHVLAQVISMTVICSVYISLGA